MKTTLVHHCAAAAIALLTFATTARGSVPVSITNAGFENPVLTTEGDYTAYIPGWTAVADGDIGVWNVETADFPGQAPQGANVAFVYTPADDQGIGQVLAEPFQSNVPYVLTVKVGNSASYGGFPGSRVQLLAGGTVIAQDDNTMTPAEGEFVTSTVTYTYNPDHSALVGQPLEIRLLSKGLGGDDNEFDDVQLVCTPSGDVTAPTLAGSDIVDDKAGGAVEVNTLVTYTVTFSEAMNAGTVTAADFGNAGGAAVTIGTVTRTAPEVFTVQATPTSTGTLQLQVNAGAELKDLAGNALDTTSAILDDTAITVTEPVLLPPGNTGSGGTITYTDSDGLNPRPTYPRAGGYVVHTFTSVGDSTMNIPVEASADVLVVAGGGAGGYDFTGSDQAGGGGGGGRGGVTNGKSGGSGGGGYVQAPGGAGTPGQGHNGADGGGGWSEPGGGGGGAGAAGTVAAGGTGVSNAISGSNVWYAGGGGGGVYEWPGDYPTSGGQGGGGKGGNKAAWGESAAYQATDGTPNTGGGGGGGGEHADPSPAHGKGGSGIVIVRYPYSAGGGFESWQSANGASGQTLADDHDKDGVPNGIEWFVKGSNNSTGFTALPGVVKDPGTGARSVSWTKDASYTGSYGTDFVVETSDSLTGTWTPEASPGTVTLTGNEVKYTFPSPLGAKKFARLKVTGP